MKLVFLCFEFIFGVFTYFGKCFHPGSRRAVVDVHKDKQQNTPREWWEENKVDEYPYNRKSIILVPFFPCLHTLSFGVILIINRG